MAGFVVRASIDHLRPAFLLVSQLLFYMSASERAQKDKRLKFSLSGLIADVTAGHRRAEGSDLAPLTHFGTSAILPVYGFIKDTPGAS